MQKEVTQSINLNDPLLLGNLLGPNDDNLRFIQDSFQARITVRGSQIEIEGSPIEVDSITTLISDMLADIDQGVEPDVESIKRSLALLHEGEYAPKELHDDVVLSYKGRVIRPKTPMQKEYLDYIRTKTITFGMGPAGTGKTYLAMAMAGRCAQSQGGRAHPAHAPGGRGGGEFGLSTWNAHREDRSLHSSALRCALRHDGPRACQ